MVEYREHVHMVTLTNGCKYPTFDYLEGTAFDDMTYMLMNCPICGAMVLVNSPVSVEVRRVMKRLGRQRRKQWATLDYFDRPT